MSALRMTLAGCLALAVATAGLAADGKKIDTNKLVGTWTFVKTNADKGPPPEVTIKLHFEKGGEMHISMSRNDKSFKIDGTYKVKGDKLTTILKAPKGDQTKEEQHTITELTDKKLVTTEERNGKTVTTEFKK